MRCSNPLAFRRAKPPGNTTCMILTLSHHNRCICRVGLNFIHIHGPHAAPASHLLVHTPRRISVPQSSPIECFADGRRMKTTRRGRAQFLGPKQTPCLVSESLESLFPGVNALQRYIDIISPLWSNSASQAFAGERVVARKINRTQSPFSLYQSSLSSDLSPWSLHVLRNTRSRLEGLRLP
jgi:hypothetical protein